MGYAANDDDKGPFEFWFEVSVSFKTSQENNLALRVAVMEYS